MDRPTKARYTATMLGELASLTATLSLLIGDDVRIASDDAAGVEIIEHLDPETGMTTISVSSIAPEGNGHD